VIANGIEKMIDGWQVFLLGLQDLHVPHRYDQDIETPAPSQSLILRVL